jgi:hypothetical protein
MKKADLLLVSHGDAVELRTLSDAGERWACKNVPCAWCGDDLEPARFVDADVIAATERDGLLIRWLTVVATS